MSRQFDSLINKEKEIYELFYDGLKNKKADILILNSKIEGVSLIKILIAVLKDYPEINYVKYDLKINKELLKTRIGFYYKEISISKEKSTPKVSEDVSKSSDVSFKLSSGDRHYYFSTLSSEGKIAYQNLLSAFKSFSKLCYVKRRGLSFDDLFNIFIGVLEDNPSVFYVDNEMEGSYDDDYFVIKIAYSIKKNQAKEYEDKITQFLIDNFSKYRSGYSEYQKALIIHDFLVEHMKYLNDNKSIRHNIIGPIFENVGVCEGFSELAKLIGDYIGVNIQCIYGDVPGSTEGHMWNLVKIEGDWYHMDITYDLAANDIIRTPHQYFLINDDLATTNHFWDKKKYPVCNSGKFHYYAKENLLFTDKSSLRSYIQNCMKNKKYETEFRYVGKGISIDDISDMALETDMGSAKPIKCVDYFYRVGDFSTYMIKWKVS